MGIDQPPDLTATSFLLLRTAFFGPLMEHHPYVLRDKRNTQDDPFDEYVRRLLAGELPEGVTCANAPGPLVTPDLVIAHSALCNTSSRSVLATDITRVVAVEVKKLERSKSGMVARASGMDYNTTPPCGRVLVYDASKKRLAIRAFYLFVCQEPVPETRGQYYLSALVLCDGNLLNSDFGLYEAIVGERTKELGLGSYGDGVNRNRPMLIFSNPLGISELDHTATLIHANGDLGLNHSDLVKVGTIRRRPQVGGESVFYCYRFVADVPPPQEPFDLVDPFPSPARVTGTQPRGRFLVDIRPTD